MRTLSDGFLAAESRYYARLALPDGTELDSDAIRSLSVTLLRNGSTDRLTLGGAPASTLTAAVRSDADLLGQRVTVWLGRLVDGALEETSLGAFTVTEAETAEGVTTLAGYDAMYTAMESAYYPTITGETTVAAVLADIAQAAGLALALPDGLTDVAVSGVSTGYTLREMAGYMAALLGCNAFADGTGALSVGWYAESGVTVGEDALYTGGASLATADWTLGRLVCSVTTATTASNTDDDGNTTLTSTEETVTLTCGDGDTGVSLSNPWMTQETLDGIYARIGGLAYRSGTLSMPGDLRIEPGDVLAVEDGLTFPVMSQTLEYDGGLKMTLTAWAEQAENGGGSGVSGPLTQAVERFTAQLAAFKQLEAQNLTALTAKISKLTATVAEIDEAHITEADIEKLIAAHAYITEADIGTLLADYIKTTELSAEIAELGYLTANSATITNLSAEVANITSILAGNIGTGNLQTVHLTADNTVIDNAVITDAMIADLSAAKITSGTIYTDNVQIANNDGQNLWIDGATIQISDGTTVRVQIGEDASGDYNLYLWNSAGTLIWDAKGLTEAGLTGNGAIIKDAAVADDAAISGTKLDISSVASCLNEDGSLTVDYSKVIINDSTLSAWYTTVNTKTDDLTTTTETLQTGLETVQGQITAKVWQTDIDSSISELNEVMGDELDKVNNELTSLTSKYSALSLTVDGITAEVGDLTTTVNGDDDTEGLVDKLASLTLTAENITATVSDNSTRVSALETQADEQASEIDALSESMVTELASLQTQIEQTAESVTISVEASITTLTETAEGLQEELSQYATYFSFLDEGLQISESDSPFAVLLGASKLSFTESGSEMAYFSNSMLYVHNAEILDSLTIGGFKWTLGSSGNLNLMKVGDS